MIKIAFENNIEDDFKLPANVVKEKEEKKTKLTKKEEEEKNDEHKRMIYLFM